MTSRCSDGGGAVVRTVTGLAAPGLDLYGRRSRRPTSARRRPPTRSTSTSSPCFTAAGRVARGVVEVIYGSAYVTYLGGRHSTLEFLTPEKRPPIQQGFGQVEVSEYN